MAHSFTRRVPALALLLGWVVMLVQPASAGAISPSHNEQLTASTAQPVIIRSDRNDVSRPLMSIAPQPTLPDNNQEIPNFRLTHPVENTGVRSDLSFVQNVPSESIDMPAPVLNFEGINNINSVYPPDTQGDIGPNHYIQWVNVSFQIWSIDKTNHTATSVYGPAAGNTLWAGFGGPCQDLNNGDPITLYDPFADRWFMSQFAIPSSPPFYQCVAVSATPDPTGVWYRYQFTWPNSKFNDYAKFGVWPDAYYMTANQFNASGTVYLGVGVAALDRNQMLAGQPASMVYYDLYTVNSNFYSMLPADFDGLPGDAPPAGAPGLFTEWDNSGWLGDPSDTLRLWEFHVDWDTPANSTFGVAGLPNALIPTANVDPSMCNFARSCIPQPGTTQKLDAVSDRLMYRLQYRNFGGYQTLVSNHTVDVGSDHAGIHWFELRKTGGGAWAMYQQGVYAPDANHRWMGSLALDHVGNLALGYSVSSSTVYPSIRYAGRLAGDSPGTLPQAESVLFTGSGSQTGTGARWGDYSMMAVDPTDDCTFWYTQEYIAVTGTANWRTRIASFRYPDCTSTQPGAFNKSAPGEGSTGVATTPTLSWGTSSGATGYEYCYDTSNDNACSSWTSSGTNTSAALSGLSLDTTYYWQVRANNGFGSTYANGSATAFWSFTTNPAAEVVLAINPESTSVALGENFDLVIEVRAGTQPVDGAAVYLNFDPDFLQVVSISAGNTLPTILENSYNNTAGQINFSASTLSSFPSGTFTLATVTFQALAPTSGTSLAFNSSSPRESDVTFEGSSILTGDIDGTIVIAVSHKIFIPLLVSS
jgi:hypothetical protein